MLFCLPRLSSRGLPLSSSGSSPSAQALQTPLSNCSVFVTGATSLPALSFSSPTPILKLPVNPGATDAGALDGQQFGASTSDSSLQGGKQAAPAPAQPRPHPLPQASQPRATTNKQLLKAHHPQLPLWVPMPAPGRLLLANSAIVPSGKITTSGFAAATHKPSAGASAGTKCQ